MTPIPRRSTRRCATASCASRCPSANRPKPRQIAVN
jgi:hypothetical protein